MIAVFILFDVQHVSQYQQWISNIHFNMPKAHIFILQDVGQHKMKHNAIFNAGIKSAGLGKVATILCINTIYNIITNPIDIQRFIETNGFDNTLDSFQLCQKSFNGLGEAIVRHIATNMQTPTRIHFQMKQESNTCVHDPYLIPPSTKNQK